MIRQKRITKQPISFALLYKGPKMKNNNSYKNRKKPRCQFKMIPTPSKFDNKFAVLELLGDIVLIERDGKISSDISILSKFCFFRSVLIDNYFNTKIARVIVEPKKGIKMIPWQQTVQVLESSDSIELKSWGILIKSFSLKYEDLVKDLEKRKNKPVKDEEMKVRLQVTAETEQKRSHLFMTSSCFCMKYRFDGTCVRLNEIVFNRNFLGDLGYSTESFASSVLKEGIPRFMSNNSFVLSESFKALLENYFTLGQEGLSTIEMDTCFSLKNNYIRDAQVKAFIFKNYEGGCSFGFDMVFSVVNKGEPYMDQKVFPKITFNKNFIKEMLKSEQNQADFLLDYYNMPSTCRYTDSKKVCKIKEIDIQEKEEDLSTFYQ